MNLNGEHKEPPCRKRTCFANSRGRCRILKRTDFGLRGCSFYKRKEEFEQERKAPEQ